MSEVVINPRKTPLKGEPNFTSVSDDRMREYKDLVQQLIFAYEYCDKEITVAMKKAYKHISDNLTDRLTYDTMTALSKQVDGPKKADEVVKKTFQKPKKIKLVKSI